MMEIVSAQRFGDGLQFGYIHFCHKHISGFCFVPFAPIRPGSEEPESLLVRPFYLRSHRSDHSFVQKCFLQKTLRRQEYYSLGYRMKGGRRLAVSDADMRAFLGSELGLCPPSWCPTLPLLPIPVSAVTEIVEPIPWHRLRDDGAIKSEISVLQERFDGLGEIRITGSLLIEGGPSSAVPHDIDIVVNIERNDVGAFVRSLRQARRVREFGRLWPVRWQGISTIICPFFRRAGDHDIYANDLEHILRGRALVESIEVAVEDDLEGLYVPARLHCRNPAGEKLEVVIHNTLGVGLMKKGQSYILKDVLREGGRPGGRYHVTEPIEQIAWHQSRAGVRSSDPLLQPQVPLLPEPKWP
jgi:hypothetical protein